LIAELVRGKAEWIEIGRGWIVAWFAMHFLRPFPVLLFVRLGGAEVIE